MPYGTKETGIAGRALIAGLGTGWASATQGSEKKGEGPYGTQGGIGAKLGESDRGHIGEFHQAKTQKIQLLPKGSNLKMKYVSRVTW